LKRGAEKKSGIKKTKPGLKPILKTNKKIEKSKKQARKKMKASLYLAKKQHPWPKEKKIEASTRWICTQNSSPRQRGKGQSS
jgi:hypothetical protein